MDALALSHPDWSKSYFAGVVRVPLGHKLKVWPGGFECVPYWHPVDAKPVRFKRDEEYAEALLEIFDRATTARLRSPRAIGTQLSSGLDSSSVAASAARLLGAEGKRLTAFTSVPRVDGFRGKGISGRQVYEGPGAAEVAAMYPNMDHVRGGFGGVRPAGGHEGVDRRNGRAGAERDKSAVDHGHPRRGAAARDRGDAAGGVRQRHHQRGWLGGDAGDVSAGGVAAAISAGQQRAQPRRALVQGVVYLGDQRTAAHVSAQEDQGPGRWR